MKRIEQTIIYNKPFGLHMRPASIVAGIARSYGSEVTFSLAGDRADACSIFELLILGIKHGDLVEISVVGHDAAAAMDALLEFLDSCSDAENTNIPGEDFNTFAA